jgi:RNA polymerase sigma-70 factor (ECF subfamily)
MNRELFENLLDEHKDAVFGLAVYLLGRQEDAEDVTQETFLRLFRAGEEIEESMARWWLLRVARNLSLDQLRRRKVRDRSHAGIPEELGRGRVGIEIEDGDRRERQLEVSDLGTGALHMEQQVELQRLVRAMETLNEPYRSVIVMRELNDLPYNEIASALDMTLSAVKVTLHRARKKLREMFPESGEAVA